MARGRLLNWLLALLSATLLILTFPRFDLAWLAPVAPAPLLVTAEIEKRASRRFLLGWVSGIVYWAGTCYWIQFVLAFHGGLAPWLSWLAFALFCVVKAAHTGVFTLLAGWLMPSRWAIVAVPALWVVIERTHAPLGFAWQMLGNAGVNMSVPARLAPFTGVYGLSFVFVMLATVLALVILRRSRRELAALVLLLALYALPPLPAPARGHELAGLIQPNLTGLEQWTPKWVSQTHRRFGDLSARLTLDADAPPIRLLVWPEVPAPVYYYEDARFRERVNMIARLAGVHVLLNAVPHTPEGAPLNSALLVSPRGEPVGRYDKMFLVPFGEFVPWPFKLVMGKISSEVGDFAAGKQVLTLSMAEHRLGAFVCYEAVFPHLVRQFAAHGAELFVNISNDGWYGRTAARHQHLKIARMRALENGRWMLRATNDGITSVIDPAGRVAQTLPSYKEGVLRAGYNYINEQTVYTRYGDWFVLLCAAVTVAGFALRRRSAGRAGSPSV